MIRPTHRIPIKDHLNHFHVSSQSDSLFDDLTALAVRSTELPICVITIHHQDKPFVKSRHGLEPGQEGEALDYCQLLFDCHDNMLSAEDVRTDSRFKGLSSDSGTPQLAFFVGVTLISTEGEKVGTVAMFDRQSRQLTNNEPEILQILSRQIIQLLELNKARTEIRNISGSLEERAKESTCLYRISNLANSIGSVDELLDKTTEILPTGWQFPEATVAAIEWGEKVFKSPGFRKTKWQLATTRQTEDGRSLKLIVGYRKKMPDADFGPFLTEEEQLLNTVAENMVLCIDQFLTHERNTLILESTEEGIYGIDEDGFCTFINRSGANLLGYRPDECVGKNMHQLIHHHKSTGEKYHQKECPIYKTKFNHSGCHVEDEVFWTKTGTPVQVRYSSTPIVAKGTNKGTVVVFNDISESKKAENELQLRERRYRALVENSVDAIAILGIDGSPKYVSPSVQKILGYSEEEAANLNLFALIHPDDQPGIASKMQEILSNPGVPIPGYTARTKHKDGSWRWLESINTNLLHDQAIEGIVDNFRDVTERVEFEQSLRDSEKKYRSLFDHSPLPKWIYNIETGGILDVNQTALDVYGYSREEFLNLTIDKLRPEKEIPRLLEALKTWDQINGNHRFGIFTHLKKTGEEMKMDVSGHRINLDGKEGLLVVCNDVTEREQAFQALRASEARYRGFYESQTNFVIRTDMEGNYTYANKKFEADFGWIYPDGKIIGKNSLTSILESDHDKVIETVEKCVTYPGTVFKVEIDKPTVDGGYVTTLWDFLCIANDKGVPSEIQCVGLDISERIKMERALLESHERFEKVTEATNDAIWEYHPQTGDLFWGKGFETQFGYDPGSVKPTFEFLISLIHPSERNKIAEKVNQYLTNENTRNWFEEYRFLKADGNYCWVVDRAVFVKNELGQTVRVVGAMTDISYRVEHEETLKSLNQQLEKHARDLEISNAELEQFAYIASHDLQEPLRMVTGFMTQLEKKYKEQLDEKAQQYIFYAVDGATRMRQIILDLLEYSRIGRHQGEKELIDLNSLIEEYRLLRKGLIAEKGAAIQIDHLPTISNYSAPITQLFHNLLDNALKYSRHTAKPTILVEVTDLKDKWEFAIRDNGIGIEPEYFDKIFVIFQRLHSKEEYSGSGLGLAIVKKIVDNMGGEIRVESQLGEGSTFFFTLKK